MSVSQFPTRGDVFGVRPRFPSVSSTKNLTESDAIPLLVPHAGLYLAGSKLEKEIGRISFPAVSVIWIHYRSCEMGYLGREMSI